MRGFGPSLALVLITDPTDGPVLDAQALQQLFALTAAEAGVALTLAAGRSAEDIATERGVSLPTVRTQIARFWRRLGRVTCAPWSASWRVSQPGGRQGSHRDAGWAVGAGGGDGSDHAR